MIVSIALHGRSYFRDAVTGQGSFFKDLLNNVLDFNFKVRSLKHACK